MRRGHVWVFFRMKGQKITQGPLRAEPLRGEGKAPPHQELMKCAVLAMVRQDKWPWPESRKEALPKRGGGRASSPLSREGYRI